MKDKHTAKFGFSISLLIFLILLALTFYQMRTIQKTITYNLGDYTINCVVWARNHPNFDTSYLTGLLIEGYDSLYKGYFDLALCSWFSGMSMLAMIYFGIDWLRASKNQTHITLPSASNHKEEQAR